MSSDLDGEWLEALEMEAPADDKPVDDKPADDAPADDKPVDDKPADDKDDDDKADDKSDDDTGDGDSGDNADDGRKENEDEKPKDEEVDPKQVAKEAVKEAMAEIETAKADRGSQIDSLKKEVADALYPEGIDRQLRDSDGDPITGIDDLTKLINPKTGELFTDEEAGAWLLSAQQKLNKDIEEVERFIEQVAETNFDVTEGAKRVAAKYGDILKADETLRKNLVEAFDKTLVKDPKTGVTLRAPLTPEEFFDPILGPMLTARAEAEQKAAEEAKAKAEAEAKANQADRGDLKPNGKGDNIDPEDKEWAQAYKDYEEGKR